MNINKRQDINPHTIYIFLIVFIILPFVFSCSSTPLPSQGSVTVPEDFFGMVHAGRSETREEYQLLDEMGAKWILSTFYWREIERKQGEFDFSSYDSFVNTAKANGKKIAAVLAYEAPWLYPEGKSVKYISPENLPHFLHFVEETVRHFKGRVDAWEIWNEPNFMFWKGSSKDFFELSRLAARTIRETDPEAYILGGAFWRSPTGFIKNMHKSGAMENLDALAFHPYAVNPSGAMKVHDSFLKTLSNINYQGAVWITEIGYPTAGWYPSKVSPEELPSYVVKTIAGAASRGTRALFWYELFDTYSMNEVPSNKTDTEDFFGLMYPDYSRKNGAHAYELCARYLPGSRYTHDFFREENIPSNIVTFCFLEGISGQNTLIIWNDRNLSQELRFQLPVPALLHDISSGESQSISEETVLSVGKKPLFITWQENTLPRLSVPE